MLAIVKESADSKPVIKQVPKPTVKDGFVVVKIMAAGLNPSDLLNAKGGFSYTRLSSHPRSRLGRCCRRRAETPRRKRSLWHKRQESELRPGRYLCPILFL